MKHAKKRIFVNQMCSQHNMKSSFLALQDCSHHCWTPFITVSQLSCTPRLLLSESFHHYQLSLFITVSKSSCTPRLLLGDSHQSDLWLLVILSTTIAVAFAVSQLPCILGLFRNDNHRIDMVVVSVIERKTYCDDLYFISQFF